MFGETLGIEVVAEGIETKEQLEQLKQFGCKFGQGYLFSRPVAVSEAAKLIGRVFRPDSRVAETVTHEAPTPILELANVQ